MPNGPPKIDDDTLRRMWMDGIRIAVIADFFGCRKSAVSRWAKLHGLPKRNNRGVLHNAPKPNLDRYIGRTPYMAKPTADPEPPRPALRYTYANVQEFVAGGMNQRQALAAIHRRRA